MVALFYVHVSTTDTTQIQAMIQDLSCQLFSELRKTPNKTELRERLGGRLPAVPLLKLGYKKVKNLSGCVRQLCWMISSGIILSTCIYIIYITTLSIYLLSIIVLYANPYQQT